MEPYPNPTVVLHACLGVGHLIPMVELAKLFLRRGITVVVTVPTPPASTTDFFASSTSAVAGLSAANLSISFHHLPPPDYPSPDPDPFLQMLDVFRLTVPSLLAFIRSLPSVAALGLVGIGIAGVTQLTASPMEPYPNPTVVLHACLGVGHLIPMVELAKLFLRRGIAVVVAVPTPPASTTDFFASSTSAVADLAAANLSISFHHLPPPDYPSPDPDPFLQMLDVLRLTVPSLLAFLRSLPSVAALVLDLFCLDALDAAEASGVPAYLYYTSAAGDLATFLHLPHYFATTDGSFKDMGKALLRFPGVPPIPASDMPHTVLDRADRTCALRVGHYRRIPKARGVLVNTYEWLEARAIRALREGACVPDRPTPPVYCIGPLIVKGEEAAKGERHACLSWLDLQPERSVVFLCFGSLGAVSAAQLKEIARGLESSGHSFLWVVRSPPEDPTKFFLPRPDPDLDALLPEGFLERTRGRGMVAKMWAPQVEVLRHTATGAFVTHCGWNSVLEAASAGVPMLCWPQYAEQRLNKVFVVDEIKVGVVMEGYDEELVKAEEVEKKVRLVMESEEAETLRERLALAKEKAAEALADVGPSRTAFANFLKDLKLLK